MTDVIAVYKRIATASVAGKGVRLTWEEVHAIACDGAVRQAINTADEEAASEAEGRSYEENGEAAAHLNGAWA